MEPIKAINHIQFSRLSFDEKFDLLEAKCNTLVEAFNTQNYAMLHTYEHPGRADLLEERLTGLLQGLQELIDTNR